MPDDLIVRFESPQKNLRVHDDGAASLVRSLVASSTMDAPLRDRHAPRDVERQADAYQDRKRREIDPNLVWRQPWQFGTAVIFARPTIEKLTMRVLNRFVARLHARRSPPRRDMGAGASSP